MLAGLSLILFAGCYGQAPLIHEAWREVAPPPRAAEAVAAVKASMGLVGGPDVHWYGGAGLDADCGGQAWHPNDAPDLCVPEEELEGVIIVAAIPGWEFHRLFLAHGMGHMLAGELYGDEDQNHVTSIFDAGGQVQVANEVLGSLGL